MRSTNRSSHLGTITQGDCSTLGASPTDGGLDIAGKRPLDRRDVGAAFPEEADARHAEPASKRADLQTMVETAPRYPECDPDSHAGTNTRDCIFIAARLD